MILKREIEEKALQQNISRDTIEKDWVLGHFIDAIFSLKECRDTLIFKGGTCLKKCYFKNYRFSEDLDFTSMNSNFVLSRDLIKKILKIIYQRTEIFLHLDSLEELKYKDKNMGYVTKIKYWGANHLKNQIPPPPNRWTTSVKIEIINYEKIVFPPTLKPIIHDYSDHLFSKEILCYDLKEIFSEKMRALIQRSYQAPRDYYDMWYLSKNVPNLDWVKIKEAFYEKIKFKNISFNAPSQLINDEHDKNISQAWKNSLAHQIKEKELPTYIETKEYLLNVFESLF